MLTAIRAASSCGKPNTPVLMQQKAMLDVYRAVDCVTNELFSFHANPNPACPVGGNVHAVVDSELIAAQNALESRLAQTTLADLSNRLESVLSQQAQDGEGGHDL